MTRLHDLAGWPSGPLHIAIGVFDGVHVGHQALVGGVARGARAAGATPMATTFDPLPVEVLAPGAPPSALTDIDERCALLEQAGARAVVVLQFTREMAALPPEEFTRRLSAAGDLRCVHVGQDFRFGHDRAGDVRALVEHGQRHGFAVEIAPPVLLGGRVVSSTRIRNALLAGDVEEAARLLGRRYSVSAVVERGDKRGRALGFPTVSLRVPPNRLLPRDGIYAMWAHVDGERVAAAASIGVRPTFGGEERRIEAYVLDRGDDLDGDRLKAEFVKRLRDELRFESAGELAEQIARDISATRAALA